MRWLVGIDERLALVASAACEAILHSLWQGALAAAIYGLFVRVAGASARSRYRLGATLLGLLPVMSVVVFASSYAQATAFDLPVEGNRTAAFPVASAPAPLTVAGAAVAAAPAVRIEVWVFTIWLLGFVVLSARSALGLALLERTVRRVAKALPGEWLERATELAESSGLGRRVRFLVAPGVDVPFTFGWLRPVVVVPAAMLTNLPPSAVELVLLHELAHLRRLDFLVNALQSLIEACFFFHPAVWWLSRRVRLDREHACDETVVEQGVDRLAYARALTELESMRTPAPSMALGSAGGSLTMRIRSILSDTGPRRVTGVGLSITVALALGIAPAVVSCAGSSLDPSPQDPAEPASGPAAGDAVSKTAIAIPWLPGSVRRWEANILAASAKHSVDADVVALMVLVESGGDESAVSSMGARGLMQIMPGTARKLVPPGEGGRAVSRLSEPDFNLDLGVALMSKLLVRHETGERAATLERAWAAYNAGSRALRRHLEDGIELPEETRAYVALLGSLYDERSAPRSPSYDAWRERVRTRAAPELVHPLKDGELSSRFGTRVHPIEGTDDFHRGIDLASPAGSVVLAPMSGTVLEAASDERRGNYVIVKHRRGIETRYHHLASLGVTAGDTVEPGSSLGTVGSSGQSTGPHLHFEVRDQGEPVDPKQWLPKTR